ncbi:MAG: hypothetical protein WBG95_08970 [Sulfitobacter sp.]
MNKMNQEFDEKTITDLFKRRRADGRYYAKSVIRSAELTKVFNVDTNLQSYLCHLIDGYVSPDWIPACNRRVRLLLERYFSKAILKKYNHEFKPNGMKLYHATIVFEEFVTGDRETHIDWPAIKKKVATLMRRLCADFIGMGEVDVLLDKNRWVGGVSQGRVLCPHFHVLFWTAVPIKTKTLSKQFSKPFDENPTGMKTVKITTCEDDPVDVRRLASYLFKSPQGGKTLWMDKVFDERGALKSGRYRQRKSSKKRHRHIVFSRLAEILSHTDVRKLMIAGGDGVILKRQLLRMIVEALRLLATPSPYMFGHHKTLLFWEIMRLRGHGAKYKVPRVTV